MVAATSESATSTRVLDVVRPQLVDVGVRVHLRDVESLDDVAAVTAVTAPGRVIQALRPVQESPGTDSSRRLP
jgi:hypothetical protein